jgi:hypothetical protein
MKSALALSPGRILIAICATEAKVRPTQPAPGPDKRQPTSAIAASHPSDRFTQQHPSHPTMILSNHVA